ncbi:hypothetical protein COO91_01143 [Nostoc flagelliforme CCNUN1]|uniref:Uncharacterized protein n=1 Tax=Nostoc flagelliforme CCNUN1 TaxID=2038116 RepID=A0A2K8SIL9_9NOSO|nr:hypothetical protein COO91_01143 [Nostoc flagelliforme CCNUN1]
MTVIAQKPDDCQTTVVMHPKGAFGRIFAPGSKGDFSPKSGFQGFV